MPPVDKPVFAVDTHFARTDIKSFPWSFPALAPDYMLITIIAQKQARIYKAKGKASAGKCVPFAFTLLLCFYYFSTFLFLFFFFLANCKAIW